MPEYLKVFPFKEEIMPAPVVVTDQDGDVEFISMAEAALPSGKYAGTITYLWEMSDTNDSAIFTTTINGTVFERQREPKDIGDKDTHTVIFPITIEDGIFNCSVEARTTQNANDTVITFASITLKRQG